MIMEVIPCPKKCGGFLAHRLPHNEDGTPKLSDQGLWESEPFCPVCEGDEVLCPTCGTQVSKEQVTP